MLCAGPNVVDARYVVRAAEHGTTRSSDHSERPKSKPLGEEASMSSCEPAPVLLGRRSVHRVGTRDPVCVRTRCASRLPFPVSDCDNRLNENSPTPARPQAGGNGRPVTTTSPLANIRSLLFAPGDDRHKLENALASDADGLIADLEDAVAEDRKGSARQLVVEVLQAATGPSVRMVRINQPGSELAAADLVALADLALEAIVVPKATPEGLATLGRHGPAIVAIVETAAGLARVGEIAAAPRVAALALGAIDLSVELGLEPRGDGQELLYARSLIVLESAVAGLRSPFDIVHLDTADEESLESEACLARSLGFRGKLCIHPAQVAIVNRVFTPSEKEVERASQLVRAYEKSVRNGVGTFAFNGEMVDRPVVERARRLLTEAERLKK